MSLTVNRTWPQRVNRMFSNNASRARATMAMTLVADPDGKFVNC